MFSLGTLLHASMHTARICLPTIVEAFGERVSGDVCSKRLFSWSAALVKQAKIQLDITGSENIDPEMSYVVVSNHQSHYDIPIAFQATQLPLRMVAKKELFSIPILAGGMRGSGFIEVDRSNGRKAIKSLQAARERIVREKTSVWIAPEGTRSFDGELGEFRSGAFHMARHLKLPILPVIIDGSKNVLPRGGTQVHKKITVKITILPALTVEQQKGSVELLAKQLREQMQDVLSQNQPGE